MHLSDDIKTGHTADRIGYLDGLRGLAILAVLGYHYFSHFSDWEKGVYPYGDMLADFPLFEYGYYGVHLFFGISGFVIALTLERCRSLDDFVVRRFARLWPTMLMCSVLTYVVLLTWPTFWPQSPANFVPSLTFINGQIWNRFVHGLDSQWIDGAYWSLFVEVKFYALAAVIYFSNREKFVQFFTAFAVLTVLVHTILRALGHAYWADLLQVAFSATYLPWFMIGIAALLQYRDQRQSALTVISTALLLLVLLVTVGERKSDLVAGGLVVVLLFTPLSSSRFARFLCQPWLAGVGVTSYSLYLLHQNMGLTLISVISQELGLRGVTALAIPVVIGGGLIFVSRMIFRHWESPLNKLIVKTYLAARTQWALRAA